MTCRFFRYAYEVMEWVALAPSQENNTFPRDVCVCVDYFFFNLFGGPPSFPAICQLVAKI